MSDAPPDLAAPLYERDQRHRHRICKAKAGGIHAAPDCRRGMQPADIIGRDGTAAATAFSYGHLTGISGMKYVPVAGFLLASLASAAVDAAHAQQAPVLPPVTVYGPKPQTGQQAPSGGAPKTAAHKRNRRTAHRPVPPAPSPAQAGAAGDAGRPQRRDQSAIQERYGQPRPARQPAVAGYARLSHGDTAGPDRQPANQDGQRHASLPALGPDQRTSRASRSRGRSRGGFRAASCRQRGWTVSTSSARRRSRPRIFPASRF